MDPSKADRLLACARSLYEQGRHYEAQRVCERLELPTARNALSPRRLGEISVIRARLALGSADFAGAEAHCRRALGIPAADASVFAEAGPVLGRALARTGRTDESISALKSALELLDTSGCSVVAGVVFDLRRGLGETLLSQGDTMAAGPRLIEAYLLGERLQRTDDTTTLRHLVEDVGIHAFRALGDRDRAAELILSIVEDMLSRGLGDDDWTRALRLIARGSSSNEAIHQRLVDWWHAADDEYERTHGPDGASALDPSDSRAVLTEFAEEMEARSPRDVGDADLALLRGQFDQAWRSLPIDGLCSWLETSAAPFFSTRSWKVLLQLWRRVYMRAAWLDGCSGIVSEAAVTGASNLSHWCRMVGEDRAAEHLLRHVFEARQAHEPSTPNARWDARLLARAALLRGDHAEAAALVGEAARAYAVSSGAQPPSWWASSLRADISCATDDFDAAEGILRAAVDDLLELDGEEDIGVIIRRLSLAEFLLERGRLTEARDVLAAVPRRFPAGDDGESSTGVEYDRLRHQARRCALALELGDLNAADDALATAREAEELFGAGTALVADAMATWADAELRSGHGTRQGCEAARAALRNQRRGCRSGHPLVTRSRDIMRAACAPQALET